MLVIGAGYNRRLFLLLGRFVIPFEQPYHKRYSLLLQLVKVCDIYGQALVYPEQIIRAYAVNLRELYYISERGGVRTRFPCVYRAFRYAKPLRKLRFAKSDKKRTIMIGIAVTAAAAALMYYGCAFRNTARWKGNSIHVFSDGASISCEAAGDIVVPQEIDGVPVTRISLSGNAITSVSLPDSVTSLNVHCSSLTEIKIPDSVRVIDDFAFSGCKSLSSVELPENLTDLGCNTFEDCTSLKSIYIPKVFYIGDGAFSGCSSLTDIYIPMAWTTLPTALSRTARRCKQ